MLKLQVGIRRLVTLLTQTLNTLIAVWCLLMPRAACSLLQATKGKPHEVLSYPCISLVTVFLPVILYACRIERGGGDFSMERK